MSKEDDGTLQGAHTELWDHDRGRGARHTLLDQPERALTCRAHPTDLTKTWVARLPSFGSFPSIHFTHSSFYLLLLLLSSPHLTSLHTSSPTSLHLQPCLVSKPPQTSLSLSNPLSQKLAPRVICIISPLKSPSSMLIPSP